MPNLAPFAVPGLSGDERVRVFRRVFDMLGVFEGLQVDAYVVISERYVVVLDTMLFPGDAAAMMEQVGDECAGRTLLCVNSHADWDHAWGNAYFGGEHAAPIIGHNYCRARLQSVEARRELEEFRGLDPLFQHVELVPPTITFSRSLTIDGGDLTIELVAAPGHQPDHIVAWIPELSLLLAFDAVEYPLPSVDGARGVPHMFATLEQLGELQARRALCSHGKTTDPGLVETTLAYLRKIERRGRVYLSRNHPDEQELAHASQLISFPFDEVIAEVRGEIDRGYYSQAHEENCGAVLRWLMTYGESA